MTNHKNKTGQRDPRGKTGWPVLNESYLAAAGAAAFAYFFLKRSTRPSVSIILVDPVKNGWHAPHVFTCISFFVERVLMTLPQAHVIVASTYFG